MLGNALLHDRHQTTTWTNVDLLTIEPSQTNFNDISKNFINRYGIQKDSAQNAKFFIQNTIRYGINMNFMICLVATQS